MSKSYNLGYAYLSTVCVATRKDIRSPAVISCLDMNTPPMNSVPSTIPAHRQLTSIYNLA